MAAQLSSHRRRAAVILVSTWAVAAAALAVMALLVGLGAGGVLLAVAVAGLAPWLAWMRSTSAVLASTGGTKADVHAHARLQNVTEGLCVTAGLPLPTLKVLDEPGANVLVAGVTPGNAVLVVTDGLLGALGRVELEAVLAHALVQVKTLRMRVGTLASALLGWLAKAGTAPAAAPSRVMVGVAGRPSDLAADAAAVALTRYPPGLVSALQKMASTETGVRSASPATAHLWVAPPLSDPRSSGHVALSERIQALKEL